MIARQLCMRQSRQLRAFSRPALNSLNRPYSVPSTDSPVQSNTQERTTEIESQYQNDQAPERISRRRSAQLAWKQKDELRHKFHELGSTVANAYKPEDIIRNPPSPSDITLELLLASQTHLGHSTSRWNPQNSRYIFGIRDGIHIISLDVTAAYLRRAAKVVEEVAARGGLILFVGTRKGQKRYVVRAAELAKGYHIFERWIPGSLTNGQQILGHCETKVVNGLDEEIPKFKEALVDRSVLKPDLVVCLNPLENIVLLHECGLNNVPTIGVVDTDADPTRVTYPIPANDDSLRAIGVIAGVLGRAGEAGQARRIADAKKGVLTYPALHSRDLLSHERLAEIENQEQQKAKNTRAAGVETANEAEITPEEVTPVEAKAAAEAEKPVEAEKPIEAEKPAEAAAPEQPSARASEPPVKDQ
ncbi:37S ribosomal protein, mitochondrial [Aspergillus hancockii]|nr:37S ribosomal protein, mitochondrial [Aspergillus hancockii]